ncbi:CD226 antigen-like [Suncus etruscus]|uniref:CD226 antigen-like n=1 Tax=Suncus etruscus TaxID=109475 RepID=UPI00210F722C|nr:CD226 antigen-like [Suncus etruscus]
MHWDTTVKLAENMTLECIYPAKGFLTQTEWFKIKSGQRESIAIYNPDIGVLIRDQYEGRVSFLNSTESRNDITLYFHNASGADVGYYSCFLHTFPYGHWEKLVRVVATDGFEIVESPEKQVVSTTGKNITLTCPLPVDSPIERITWEKIQPHQIDLLSKCDLPLGQSDASKFHREIWSSCSKDMPVSIIILYQVLVSDSAIYQCEFQTLKAQNASCLIKLTVNSDDHDSLYILFIVGGIIILLVLISLISMAIFFFYKKTTTK